LQTLLLNEIILNNGLPTGYVCVSTKFVRHPGGFAVGALVKSNDNGHYYIYTGTRIANVPQEWAKGLDEAENS